MSDQQPIERSFFREADDGSTVFFPWGLAQRGYRVPDDAAKKRASRATSLLIGSVIGVGTWMAHALQPILESDETGPIEILHALAMPGAALLLAFVAYTLWISRFVEKLPESDLRVSRDERLREASELTEPWKIALIGVVLFGLSALLVYLQPHAWWLGLLVAALGVGALRWSALLRRAGADPSRQQVPDTALKSRLPRDPTRLW